MKKTLFLAASLLALATPARAADTALTEDMVRQYYANSITAMKGTYEESRAFIKNGFTDDYTSTQDMTLTIPGSQPRKNMVTQSKKDLLAEPPQNHEMARAADIQNNLKEIHIEADGKTARVVDATDISATMNSPGGRPLAMKTSSLCNDILVLNGTNVQISKSACTAETAITAAESK